MTIAVRGKYFKRCTAVSNNLVGDPQDFFTLNLSSWDENSSDPSGGANLVITCTVYMHVYDSSLGGAYGRDKIWFRFTRKGGTALAVLDNSIGSPFGSVAPNYSSVATSGSICKLQVSGIGTHNLVFDGVVHYESHY